MQAVLGTGKPVWCRKHRTDTLREQAKGSDGGEQGGRQEDTGKKDKAGPVASNTPQFTLYPDRIPRGHAHSNRWTREQPHRL